MAHSFNLKGCRILVKNFVTSQLLADTTVNSFDPHYNRIRISASSISNVTENQLVLVWIFGAKTIYEYSGRMRRAITSNQFEIALFSGHAKEHRTNVRHKIASSGLISGIIINKQRISLRKPIEIITKDISRNGILFKSMTGSLDIGSAFLLTLKTSDKWFRNEYRVVRINEIDLEKEEYGCQVFTEKPE